jgi:hypothetical protein
MYLNSNNIIIKFYSSYWKLDLYGNDLIGQKDIIWNDYINKDKIISNFTLGAIYDKFSTYV